MYDIIDIEGIGPIYAEKLKAIGIANTDQLLEATATPKGRKELAEKAEISPKLVLTWANLADLMRVKGVGTQFAELLEAAGVDTIKELRTRNADNLAAKMKEVMEEKKITRASPAVGVVQEWIEQAKAIDPKLSY